MSDFSSEQWYLDMVRRFEGVESLDGMDLSGDLLVDVSDSLVVHDFSSMTSLQKIEYYIKYYGNDVEFELSVIKNGSELERISI